MECIRIYSIHDQAITFDFAEIISEDVNIHVIALKEFIELHPFNGFIESVPAYSSLTIYFNKEVNKDEVINIIKTYNSQLSTINKQQHTDTKIIPVCYELGDDFSSICATLNLKTDELIQLHSTPTYRVYMIGFTPGFPYMGTVPEALEMPRKNIPSLNIEAGSVAIAGKQTGIYPRNSPGGWHVIGKTPVKMYDKKRNPVCFLKAGDLVNFKPISKEAFDQYK
jgi:inhibitor of KinA